MTDTTPTIRALSWPDRVLCVLFAVMAPVVFYFGKATVILLALLTLTLFVRRGFAGLRTMEPDWSVLFPLLFLSGPAIGLVHAYAPDVAMLSFGHNVLVFLLCVFALVAAKGQALPEKIWHIGAGGLLVAVTLSLFEQTGAGGPARWILNDAQFARFMDKDGNRGLCAMAVLMWPFAYALFGFERYKQVVVALVLFALLLVLRPSASALMAASAGGAVLLALWAAPRVATLVKAGMLSVVAVFPALALWLYSHLQALAFLPDSFKHRIYIWEFAREKWMERPLFGWGMDSARLIPGAKDMFPGTHFPQLPLHTHNIVMQVLLEQGVAGYAVLVGGFALFLAVVKRSISIGVTSAVLIPALFAFGMWQGWWIATACIAATLCAMLPRDFGLNGGQGGFDTDDSVG